MGFNSREVAFPAIPSQDSDSVIDCVIFWTDEGELTFSLMLIDAGLTGLCGSSKDLIWSFYWYSFLPLV